MGLVNPVALITGGSRGIGRGIALALAGAGFDLAINYATQRDTALQTAGACVAQGRQSDHSLRVDCFQANLGVAAERTRLVDEVRQAFGRLDILVNNAGVAPKTRLDLLETTEESFDAVFAINVKGHLFLTQQVARWMVEQAKAGAYKEQSAPKIITISSISAYTASINRGEYCMVKAALSMLTPLFATRLAPHGILVYEIRPGIIATDMTRGVKDKYDQLIANGLTPIARWGTPEDIGRAVAAIARDAFPFSTGEVFNVDGGFHIRRL